MLFYNSNNYNNSNFNNNNCDEAQKFEFQEFNNIFKDFEIENLAPIITHPLENNNENININCFLNDPQENHLENNCNDNLIILKENKNIIQKNNIINDSNNSVLKKTKVYKSLKDYNKNNNLNNNIKIVCNRNEREKVKSPTRKYSKLKSPCKLKDEKVEEQPKDEVIMEEVHKPLVKVKIPVKGNVKKYYVTSDLLNDTQFLAAKKLGINLSTFSRAFKEAVSFIPELSRLTIERNKNVWPYRCNTNPIKDYVEKNSYIIVQIRTYNRLNKNIQIDE